MHQTIRWTRKMQIEVDNAWVDARKVWNDETAERFLKMHYQPASQSFIQFISAAEELSQALDDAETVIR